MAAREFRRAGVPVTFFAGSSAGEAQGLDGIDVIGLGGHDLLESRPLSAMRNGIYNARACEALRRWIARHDTPQTVYHLHNWSQILSPAIFEPLRAVDDRTVVTCHDFFNVCPNGGFVRFRDSEPCALQPLSLACLASQCDRRSGRHKYWRAVRQLQLQRSARFAESRATFTFLHERMVRRFVEAGFAAADLRVIANPVEPWSRRRIAAEHNDLLLFVGRIGRDKGADIAALAAKAADLPIALIGTGELSQEICQGFPNARVLGWRDRQGILAEASRARVLVVPSRVTEPFGLVILEAAMSGLPVLVSNRAYLSIEAEREGFGMSFDPGDVGALTGLLKDLAIDDTSVGRMSCNGFARAAALANSPVSWAGEFLKLFEEKLGKARHRSRRMEQMAEA
ncbi:glycosyltransferase [Altererythrobacter soli]|uniref:Glycosyltransferase n=2 Tax=Croceibacterium soli TaxID=1739690 RepID=A0A6I4UR53_9SPHN|nr:glycosyltransferase [Croceibacterium soli]